ncbi:hypothetical protein LIA77_05682 [Sarocladium implicatum]|nr:hypothetical protein LIA77_05682 [Sarocladium implicatum]
MAVSARWRKLDVPRNCPLRYTLNCLGEASGLSSSATTAASTCICMGVHGGEKLVPGLLQAARATCRALAYYRSGA